MTADQKRRYILRCAALRDRLTNKAIARRLNVSPKHVQNTLGVLRRGAR